MEPAVSASVSFITKSRHQVFIFREKNESIISLLPLAPRTPLLLLFLPPYSLKVLVSMHRDWLSAGASTPARLWILLCTTPMYPNLRGKEHMLRSSPRSMTRVGKMKRDFCTSEQSFPCSQSETGSKTACDFCDYGPNCKFDSPIPCLLHVADVTSESHFLFLWKGHFWTIERSY